ncbi:hypothetical protein [Paraburkholderia bannensis]|uniref:hypothetical protein n=1 Tax=Paraburkholderia bannensis TaxID=765414 RepID=UPI000A9AA5C9|nr:hypothetical protein [Paraburkholderia bannensis]
MITTLLLDRTRWDLCLDASGNIALASAPYAVAQDVASAVRTFLGEVWFETTQGVPYWQDILGKFSPLSIVKKDIVNAAMTVQTVTSARCFITGFSYASRVLTGQVQAYTADSPNPILIDF